MGFRRLQQRQRQRSSAAPGMGMLVGWRRRRGKGLNRGLQVRGALRGSQMVSHKWFTATCEVHEWGEGCVDDWQCCAARAPAPADGHG